MLADPFFQPLPFPDGAPGKRRALDDGHVTLLGNRLHLLGGEAVVGRTICDGLDEVATCLGSVVLELGAIHIKQKTTTDDTDNTD
ncbi:MAG: hypothetical protein L0312_05880 [Acidobacteria bacterium]|nr:hypothetical protein [Acidobacteriota bacterium]